MNISKELSKFKLVEIIFDDPAEFDTNYCKDDSPIECRTIGWLVKQTEKYVNIVWLAEENNEPYVGLSIPQGCIKKILQLNTMPMHQISNHGIDDFTGVNMS